MIVEGLICRNQQQRRQEYYWSDLYWLAWCVYCPIESSMQENLWNLLKLLLWHPFLLWVNAPDLRGRTGWGEVMCLVAGLSFARKPRKPKTTVISCSLIPNLNYLWMWKFMATHPKQHLQCVSEMQSPVKGWRTGVDSNCVWIGKYLWVSQNWSKLQPQHFYCLQFLYFPLKWFSTDSLSLWVGCRNF